MAFQEGFERLFDIMAGEGMLEGGSVIVKDCLDVCLNVLAGSSLTKVCLGCYFFIMYNLRLLLPC